MHFTYENPKFVALVKVDDAESLEATALIQTRSTANSLKQVIIHHASKFGNARYVVPDPGTNMNSDFWTTPWSSATYNNCYRKSTA